MKKRVFSIMLAALAVSAALAGCGGSSASDSAREYKDEPVAAAEESYAYETEGDYDYATDDVYEYDTTGGAANDVKSTAASQAPSDAEIQSNSNRKLIKTVNMSAETREFDDLIANITKRINDLGGYAETMEVHGNTYNSTSARSAFIVARIPAEKLDMFVTDVSDQSNITSKTESAEDVTLQYADVEAHKESLKIEQERLNELLEQADTLENIIELENRLTDVRYEIESYESRLRMMNNQVVYSTVNLSVQEVKEYTPEPVEEKTFGQRLSEGFLESCENAWELIQDFIIGFISFLPTLIVLLIILFVIFIIVFGIVKAIIAFVKATNKKKALRKSVKKDGKVVAKAVDTPPAEAVSENKEDTKNE